MPTRYAVVAIVFVNSGKQLRGLCDLQGLKKRGIVRAIRHFEVALFSVALGLMMFADRTDFKPTYRSILTFLFGPQDARTSSSSDSQPSGASPSDNEADPPHLTRSTTGASSCPERRPIHHSFTPPGPAEGASSKPSRPPTCSTNGCSPPQDFESMYPASSLSSRSPQAVWLDQGQATIPSGAPTRGKWTAMHEAQAEEAAATNPLDPARYGCNRMVREGSGSNLQHATAPLQPVRAPVQPRPAAPSVRRAPAHGSGPVLLSSRHPLHQLGSLGDRLHSATVLSPCSEVSNEDMRSDASVCSPSSASVRGRRDSFASYSSDENFELQKKFSSTWS